MIIADFKSGEAFGEIALLDGDGRSADAIALTNCELVVLERCDLVPFLERRPGLCIALLRTLCAKIRVADERSSDFLFLDLTERLAKALLKLCPSDQKAGRPGRTSLTQGELAKIVGATRPNVNRQLRAWEKQGVIKHRKGWIVVVDPDQLESQDG